MVGSVWAQQSSRPVLFTQPDSLWMDVSSLIDIQQAGSEEEVTEGSVLDSLSTLLSEKEQLRFFEAAQAIYKKSPQPAEELKLFYECIRVGKVGLLNEEQLERLMVIVRSTYGFYPSKVGKHFLHNSLRLMTEGVLQRSTYSSTSLLKGNIDFGYIPAEGETLSQDMGEWFQWEEDSTATEVVEQEVEEEDNMGEVTWSSDQVYFESSDEQSEDTAWEEEQEKEEFVAIPENKKPMRVGPYLKLDEATLTFQANEDSLALEEITAEVFYLSDSILIQEAKVYWENVGYPRDSVYAVLKDFSFELGTRKIEAHSSNLFYYNYGDTLLEGNFQYSLTRINQTPEKAKYPYFQSYYHNVVIKERDYELTGGITLEGRKFSTEALGDQLSQLKVFKEDTLMITSRAKIFKKGSYGWESEEANLNINYLEKDSIVHPKGQLEYNYLNKTLFYLKADGIYEYSPYIFSFHKVGVYSNALHWNLQKGEMNLETWKASERVPSYVNSEHYFDLAKYKDLGSYYDFHPLALVYWMARKQNDPLVDIEELSERADIPLNLLERSIGLCVAEGYMDYDQTAGEVTLLPKGVFVHHAYLFYKRMHRLKRKTIPVASKDADSTQVAKTTKKLFDYDNLNLESTIEGAPNLTLYLKDSTLKVRGVERFSMSDTLRIQVTPRNKEVLLKENRNMMFGGEVRAGNLIFRGNQFDFDYDSFQVNLTDIQSVSFWLPGQQEEAPNSIVNTGGVLRMNGNNKSGMRQSKASFRAPEGGRMDFDEQVNSELKPEMIEALPESKRVYMKIPNINVDNINEEMDMTFSGEFYSGNIFIPFEDTIRLNMRDKAFGFKRKQQEYPLYEKDNAGYIGTLILDSKGLRGNGELNYLGSNFRSDDFQFYTDSVTTVGNSARIESEIHPRVDMDAYSMTWHVYQDSMVFNTMKRTIDDTEPPFRMYADMLQGGENIAFTGTLALMPSKVAGDGKIETQESKTESHNFKFRKRTYESDNSTFTIKGETVADKDGLRGVHMHVLGDLERNEVVIKKEGQDSQFTFPNNEFKTEIEEARWKILEKKVYMNSQGDRKNFASTKNGNSPLIIPGKHAIYDLQDYSLSIGGVENITVANSYIYPSEEDSVVMVGKGGEIENLENAEVVFDKDNQYHRLTNANIQVVDSRNYKGSGYYLYHNEENDTITLSIDEIGQEYVEDGEVETTIITAKGEVLEEDAFLFKPGFRFSGKYMLKHDMRYMGFDGKFRLEVDEEGLNWYTYKKDLSDPENDSLPVIIVDENLEMFGQNYNPKVGIYLNTLAMPQGTFLHYDEKLDKGRAIVKGVGKLSFKDGLYQVKGDGDMLTNPYYWNHITYDHMANEIRFEGKMELIKNVNIKEYQVDFYGKGHMNVPPLGEESLDAPIFESHAAIYLRAEALKKGKSAIKEDIGIDDDRGDSYEPQGAVILSHHRQEVLALLRPLIDNGDTELFGNFGETMETGELLYDIARLSENGILISNAHIKWSEEGAFYNEGTIGLVSAFGVMINQEVDGLIEIPKAGQRGDDYTFRLYFEKERVQYFISVERGKLSVWSSNEEFMNGFAKSKVVNLLEQDDVIKFRSNFNIVYLDKEPGFGDDFGNDNFDGGGTGSPMDDQVQPMDDDDGGF
ncbi:hypothetical protein GCM10023331_33290 [Algivirga pacifica]|uniref:Uncharacterized protein n=1 Tax=Algivirga pacifica TaxID=1162670 RepID=A0ABP9DHZ8_9BACT